MFYPGGRSTHCYGGFIGRPLVSRVGLTFAAHGIFVRSLALAGLALILSASGADLTQLGTSSIAYNGGNGGLLSLMLGADGFVYVSNTNAIFKVVPQ